MKLSPVIYLGLFCASAASATSFLTAQKFPSTFNDLSFTDRMAVLGDGYDEFGSEFDPVTGRCIKFCAYDGITLDEEFQRRERATRASHEYLKSLGYELPSDSMDGVPVMPSPAATLPPASTDILATPVTSTVLGQMPVTTTTAPTSSDAAPSAPAVPAPGTVAFPSMPGGMGVQSVTTDVEREHRDNLQTLREQQAQSDSQYLSDADLERKRRDELRKQREQQIQDDLAQINAGQTQHDARGQLQSERDAQQAKDDSLLREQEATAQREQEAAAEQKRQEEAAAAEKERQKAAERQRKEEERQRKEEERKRKEAERQRKKEKKQPVSGRTCRPEQPEIPVHQVVPFGEPLLGRPRISSTFNYNRLHPVDGVVKAHNGYDFATPENSSVFSPADGVVEAVFSNSSCGNGLRIKHGDRYTTGYCHLNKVLVKQGDKVEAGCEVAKSGNTGKSTGPHLHYVIKHYVDGQWVPVHPYDFIGRDKEK